MTISERARAFASTLALTTCVTSLAPRVAAAESDAARAVRLFEQGRKLARGGRCDDAVPVLRESIRYGEGIGALLNLGSCLEQLGKMASAVQAFRRAEEVASARKDEPRRVEAHRRATKLEPRLAHLVVRVAPDAETEELAIRVDGQPLAKAGWNQPIAVDPGVHTIDVTSPPAPPRSEPIEVADEANVTWAVPFVSKPPKADAPPVGSAPPSSREPPRSTPASRETDTTERSSGSTARTLGIVVGATGAAAIATGALFGVLSINAHGTVVDRCPAYPRCDEGDRDELDGLNDRASTHGTISTISFVAGGVLVVAGAVLYLTAPGPLSSRAAKTSIPFTLFW